VRAAAANVPHPSQLGQRPSHFAAVAPHSEQIKEVSVIRRAMGSSKPGTTLAARGYGREDQTSASGPRSTRIPSGGASPKGALAHAFKAIYDEVPDPHSGTMPCSSRA